MKKFILGYKLPMTQIFTENGERVSVTKIQAGPCYVTQVKTKEKDGYTAVQIGFGVKKKLKKPQAGHVKEIKQNIKSFQEFRVEETGELTKGKTIDAGIFTVGEKVKVTGISKGKGFQGVVKRHGFRGGKKSHGHKDQLRMPGSLGSGHPQRVFKGKRMGGHMGTDTVSVKNMQIIAVDSQNNIILVKGAIPGATGGLVSISS